MGILTPLQIARVRSIFKRKIVEPCVCLREREPESMRFAIREITYTQDGPIVDISRQALSPKARSSAELKVMVLDLLEKSKNGPIRCGESNRTFTSEDLQTWLRVIGKPVLKIEER